MPFQKVEFEFPDEDNEIEVEPSSAEQIDLSGKKQEEVEAEDEVEIEAEAETEVEVYDDTPKADRNRKPSDPPEDVTDEELEDYSEKVRKRIQHFSKGYHDERRAKEKAERERQELEKLAQSLVDENKRLKSDVSKNQTALLEQAKRSTLADLEAAKRAYKEAYDAGDSDKVLEAQENLTNIKIKADKLDNFQIPALQDDYSDVQPEQQITPQRTVDPKAAAWLQNNHWFDRDTEMTSFAMGLHNKLVNEEGIDPKTDEYYERIDARMRQVFPEKFEDSLDAPKTRKKSNNVVAPATRSTAPKKIRLSTTAMALAKRLGLTPEQYAEQVAKDMRKQNG